VENGDQDFSRTALEAKHGEGRCTQEGVMHAGGEMIDVHGQKSIDMHGSQRERKQRVAGGHRRKAAR
jgi:hypothetical protein